MGLRKYRFKDMPLCLEHLEYMTEVVDIFYIIAIFAVAILLSITIISFIIKFFKRNDNLKRITFLILYLILMACFCLLIFYCYRRIDSLVERVSDSKNYYTERNYYLSLKIKQDALFKDFRTVNIFNYFIIAFYVAAIALTSVLLFCEVINKTIISRKSGEKSEESIPLNMLTSTSYENQGEVV